MFCDFSCPEKNKSGPWNNSQVVISLRVSFRFYAHLSGHVKAHIDRAGGGALS